VYDVYETYKKVGNTQEYQIVIIDNVTQQGCGKEDSCKDWSGIILTRAALLLRVEGK
jgi:hypothetical protein